MLPVAGWLNVPSASEISSGTLSFRQQLKGHFKEDWWDAGPSLRHGLCDRKETHVCLTLDNFNSISACKDFDLLRHTCNSHNKYQDVCVDVYAVALCRKQTSIKQITNKMELLSCVSSAAVFFLSFICVFFLFPKSIYTVVIGERSLSGCFAFAFVPLPLYKVKATPLLTGNKCKFQGLWK